MYCMYYIYMYMYMYTCTCTCIACTTCTCTTYTCTCICNTCNTCTCTTCTCNTCTCHVYMYMYFELFHYRRFVRITAGEMSYFRPEDREVGTYSSSRITVAYFYKDIPIIRTSINISCPFLISPMKRGCSFNQCI